MGLLDKLFGFGKKEPEIETPIIEPDIRFGRYSDNNKSLAKTNRWYEAESLFKESKIDEGIEAFFDYIRDDQEDNVILTKESFGYSFDIYQGTKIVHGKITDTEITAEVSLAKMEVASVPVMRRLLEQNYDMYFSRFALNEDTLCMIFDLEKSSATPNKLYYGLKELATMADKEDDLLVSDFLTLKAIDDSHVKKFSETESEVKYEYFKTWIETVLNRTKELNPDNFSGGIAYMFLALIYKIDFLICPEGKLLNELERINSLYWNNKDEKTPVERNQMLRDAFVKLLAWDKNEIIKYFYCAKATFSITLPKPHQAVVESIQIANANTPWYLENNHNDIAFAIMEYGISYCQYSYSLPKPLSDLFLMYMKINYSDFFAQLNFKNNFVINGIIQKEKVYQEIQRIMDEFRDKYQSLAFNTDNLNYNSLVEFNLSYLKEIESLNFESTKH